MGRLLAIDYGIKRTGLAVTDPLRIIATPLDTVATADLLNFLRSYFAHEAVDEVVIGMPRTVKNEDSETAPMVRTFIQIFKQTFTQPIHEIDERFTTRIAQRAMIDGGMKKKDRREKGVVDRISATIILQDFMASRK
ncbi:MAG: Holliday junction resolvase RuvX [Bacteroidia bacterium]|nr:Holliday junction resolvase RuvX [Bacteroidia bacterium]